MIITDIVRIGDPQIVAYNGKYYCYATNTDHYSEGFDVSVSDDLIHWGEKIHCFHAIDSWGKSHFWAPEVVYHNGKFVMHYTAKSRELDSLRLGVAVADHPMGPWQKPKNNPVLSCREDLFGAGHNAFFTGFDGKLYTAFHIQTNPEKPSGDRRTVIGQVAFGERNGEIYETIE